jgi:hypothetical protein
MNESGGGEREDNLMSSRGPSDESITHTEE